MKFSWKTFCDSYRVEYDTGKKDLQIRCPFAGCASESGKRHMGLATSVLMPVWHCWKCDRGGVRPEFLIRAILAVSQSRAEEIIKECQGAGGVDDFDSLLDSAPAHKPPVRQSVIFPKTVHALYPQRKNGGAVFIKYLAETRGFGADAERVAQAYDLRFSITGLFALRLVVPVFSAGRLVSFTGRTIADADPPYLTAPGTDIKDHVAGWDSLNRRQRACRTLLIVEGPMDYMKLDYFGERFGVRATCTFGIAYTPRQVNLLRVLLDKWFDQAVVIYDRAAELVGGQLAEDLRLTTHKKVTSKTVGAGFGNKVKDPGDLSPAQVVEFVQRIEEAT